MRVFRLGRLFKLFKSLKTLKIIYSTVVETLSAIMNVGLLMFLTVMIYAVVGIALFGSVKHSGPMNKRLNFGNFLNAFMTLIRICTGEGWNDLMYALSARNSHYHSCEEDPVSYIKYVENGYEPNSCGANYLVT